LKDDDAMNRLTDTQARRAEDKDKVSRFNAWWDRWGKSIAWPIAVYIFFWAKVNYFDRLEVIPVLQAQARSGQVTDSITAAELTAIKIQLGEHEKVMLMLTKMQCLSLDPVERVKIQLDCRDIPVVKGSDIVRNLGNKR
jgi:hypothetical protein